MKQIITSILIFALASFASADIQPGKIIGTDDMIEVSGDGANLPEKLRPLVNAFGWTNYGCTVTHIGRGYVISAGHCFDGKDSIERGLSCSFVHVRWKYRKGLPEQPDADCERIEAVQKNDTNDFAILKMKNYPEEFISVDLTSPVMADDVITIFSHPSGGPLTWSQFCPIEAKSQDNIPSNYLQYSCDTNPGSSGAALIDANSLQIVGIHKGGYTNMNYGTSVMGFELRNILKELGF